jgi:hypothetical protein
MDLFITMTVNVELAQYLAEIFRRETASLTGTKLTNTKTGMVTNKTPLLQDRNVKQFVVDQKYSLCLDEII